MVDAIEPIKIEVHSFGVDRGVAQINGVSDYVFTDTTEAAQVNLVQHFVERSEDRIKVI